MALFSLSLSLRLSFTFIRRFGRTRVENIRTHRKNFGKTCLSIPSARGSFCSAYESAFSSVYVLVLHIERMRLLETTTTKLLLTYTRIYTKRGGDVARLRGGEKAVRSEERALFKLLSGCFCFVFFSLVRCCCCSHLSLGSTTPPYVLHLCSVARILQS